MTAVAGTSAASAAKWAELTSAPYYEDATIQGTLSLQRHNYIPYINPPVECPINAPYAAVWGGTGSTLAGIDDGFVSSEETCENGLPFAISFTGHTATAGSMTIDGGVEDGLYQSFSGFDEAYTQYPFTVSVVNGTGGTKTKLVFNNTRISHPFATPIRATGELEISSPSGGTYTLVP